MDNPKEEGRYLCLLDYAGEHIWMECYFSNPGYCEGVDWHFIAPQEDSKYPTVLHWQPLPPDPTKQNENPVKLTSSITVHNARTGEVLTADAKEWMIEGTAESTFSIPFAKGGKAFSDLSKDVITEIAHPVENTLTGIIKEWSIEGVSDPTHEQYFRALVHTGGAIAGIPYRTPDGTLKTLDFSGLNEGHITTFTFKGPGIGLSAEMGIDAEGNIWATPLRDNNGE